MQLAAGDLFLLNHSNFNFSAFQRFGISSSASPEPSQCEHESSVEINGQESTKSSDDMKPGEAKVTDQVEESGFNSES